MRKQHQQGFTLIELLVVMAILVLLSVISYRALVTALETRQIVDEYNEQLREFELGLFLLSKDFQQVQVAPLPAGALAFASDFGAGEHDNGTVLTLMRAADANQLRGVVPVTYLLKDGQLLQQVGTNEHSHTFRTPILSGIKTLSVVFDDLQGRQTSVWQHPSPPDMVTLTMHHQRYGKLIIKERINGL